MSPSSFSNKSVEKPDWLKPSQIPISPQDVAAKYDAISEQYDSYTEMADYQPPKMIVPILEQFLTSRQCQLDRTEPILDAGCGSGLIGAALATGGFSCISGFDLSNKCLDIARQKDVYRHLVSANLLETLPYPDSYFLASFCIGVFSRFKKQQITKILCELARVTRPLGLIVFSHRSDMIAETNLLSDLSQQTAFKLRQITDPLPYLPNLEDYAGIDIQYVFLQIEGA